MQVYIANTNVAVNVSSIGWMFGYGTRGWYIPGCNPEPFWPVRVVL